VHNGMGFVLMQLGELDEAIEHYREAIAIEPGRARAYRNMADALRRQGRFAESIETLSRAIKEVPGDVEVSAELAWVLATAPQDELRDGERAVHLAQHLCREASGGTARLLDILAAAYAETGRFDEAVATAQRAVYLARVQKDPELAHLIDRRRLLYRTHRPYRLPLGPE